MTEEEERARLCYNLVFTQLSWLAIMNELGVAEEHITAMNNVMDTWRRNLLDGGET